MIFCAEADGTLLTRQELRVFFRGRFSKAGYWDNWPTYNCFLPLRNEDSLEEKIRRWLGLPPEAPDPQALSPETLSPLRGPELERELGLWHSEDRRADVARFVASAMRPHTFAQKIGQSLQERRAWRALGRASWIRFEATHPISPQEQWAVEGDLFFPGGSIPFHFIAAEGLAEHVVGESAGRDDYLYCEENDLLFENRWIVLPGPVVSKEAAYRALREWYRRRYMTTRRHRVASGWMPRVDVFLDDE
jgi:hypothetical protein